MRLPVYRHMLEHEFSRPRHHSLISDLYDAPAWQTFMGPCVSPNNRIGLQFCVDGIPAFAANTLSLKPAEFVNLSLPPTERGKIENILLLMLLPSSMKGDQSKKYYDFASRYELQDLFDNGKFFALLSSHTHTHTHTHTYRCRRGQSARLQYIYGHPGSRRTIG